jgi:aspartyl-tRNA(Asn)/glutamyl-tRNA(Gln) amidotransferase subunit B
MLCAGEAGGGRRRRRGDRRAEGLREFSDTGAIDTALAAHPAQIAQYAANPKVLGFFVGQVMKATGGKANPALVNELLRKKLAG